LKTHTRVSRTHACFKGQQRNQNQAVPFQGDKLVVRGNFQSSNDQEHAFVALMRVADKCLAQELTEKTCQSGVLDAHPGHLAQQRLIFFFVAQHKLKRAYKIAAENSLLSHPPPSPLSTTQATTENPHGRVA